MLIYFIYHFYVAISEAEIEELDNNVDNELDKNLQLIIQINNNLTQTIDLLQKINTELCKMVSNVNNVSFVFNLKRKDIHDAI